MLVLIALAIGGFLWWRTRRNRLRGLPFSTAEENIPLNSHLGDESKENGEGNGFRSRKGKQRADSLPEEDAIFDVGDDGDEEEDDGVRVMRWEELGDARVVKAAGGVDVMDEDGDIVSEEGQGSDADADSPSRQLKLEMDLSFEETVPV